MLEISRRHSVMLHGSCIPSFEIERATMNCHDQRGPSRASLHGLRSEVEFRRKPRVKYLGVLLPFLQGTGWSKKKTDSGPDFRLCAQLTRSRHPSASGRRIGSSPGDGWAARRDPETNAGVFYWAGL
jgi:hypothetical protein